MLYEIISSVHQVACATDAWKNLWFLFCFVLIDPMGSSYVYEFMPVHHIRACYSQMSEEGIKHPGTRVMDGCELPCGCRESNLGLLQEHVPLTTGLPETPGVLY